MTKYRITTPAQATKENDIKYAIAFGVFFVFAVVPMLYVFADHLAK